MRITFGMTAAASLRNIEANQERLANVEGQLTSGSRLSKPSDDPIAVARAMSFQESIDQSGQYMKNIDQGSAWLNQADSTLDAVTRDLQRARELTVQAANGTLSPADRIAVQLEITQLQQSVLDLSHAKVGAYYIFSGTKSDIPGYLQPASSVTTPLAFQGNAATVSREVSPGVAVAVNANAQATFDPIFDAMSQIQSGLSTGSNATLQASLSALDTALDAINVTRAEVGAKSNRLESLGSRQQAVTTNLAGLLSTVKDVDMAEAITTFTMAQNVYQASIKSAAQSLQPSLLDFLH
jgi:flagellar hook-associated protein 3 FlgL